MRKAVTACLCLLFALPAWAAEDPPGRVARLSHIEGEVSMSPAGTQEWSEAVLNRPLTSEDRLWVDREGRAELQIDAATIHLDASTEFAFLELDDDVIAMRLSEGRATIRVLRKREREHIEIDTPNATVALLHPGEYHIEVDQDGDVTVVKARSGEAEVRGEGRSYLVRANEMGVLRGADAQSSDISALGPRTAFENWANDRARRGEQSESSRYVSESVIGYEDLDEHGRWYHEPEYGYVWQPTHVVAGWAPYRYGRWVWMSPWGWTWVDDARWGFAPFHYGRWAYVRHRWCWVPGPRHVRAVYAPALVAWVGGPHASVSISLGHGVGWFPLGPREIYVPGYWHSHRYIRSVNISNTIIVDHVHIDRAYRGRHRDFGYRYFDRPHAVTVVEREHFVRGRPIGRYHTQVSDERLRRWGHDPRPPALTPRRESILAGQPRTVVRSSHRGRDATHRADSRRVSFERERRAIEANGGRPVTRTALIERNPKEGRGVHIPRGGDGRSDARARVQREHQNAAGRIERMPATEHERERAGQAVHSPRASVRGLAPRERVERPREGQRAQPRGQHDAPTLRSTPRSERAPATRQTQRSQTRSGEWRSGQAHSSHAQPRSLQSLQPRQTQPRQVQPRITQPLQMQSRQMQSRQMQSRQAPSRAGSPSHRFEQRSSGRSTSASSSGRSSQHMRSAPGRSRER